jgi:3-methyladenine DNA glycosylase AlkD
LRVINSKTEVRKILGELEKRHTSWITEQAIQDIYKQILGKKIKFPVLEDFSEKLFLIIPVKQQASFLQKIIDLQTIGGNVIAGKILQEQINTTGKILPAFKLAEKFILQGDQWYVCDIIGERVFGHALLHFPKETISELKKLASHNNEWMVRCIGVAAHYAVKKGLEPPFAEIVFKLLLKLSSSTSFHTKKGIGWAAKTIAKFHPGIIKKYEADIYEDEDVKQWFKTKIKIGLGRSKKYAATYYR